MVLSRRMGTKHCESMVHTDLWWPSQQRRHGRVEVLWVSLTLRPIRRLQIRSMRDVFLLQCFLARQGVDRRASLGTKTRASSLTRTMKKKKKNSLQTTGLEIGNIMRYVCHCHARQYTSVQVRCSRTASTTTLHFLQSTCYAHSEQPSDVADVVWSEDRPLRCVQLEARKGRDTCDMPSKAVGFAKWKTCLTGAQSRAL